LYIGEEIGIHGTAICDKKLVYMGNTNYLNTRHNKAMANINLMSLHQEKLEDIQDFRDQ